MSLAALCTNFFSVASDRNAGIDSEGAIERDYQLTLDPNFINVKGAIQGVSKRDVIEIFGKRENVPIYKIFHTYKSLVITSGTFILTHKNPLQRITNWDDRVNMVCYQYLGERDPVVHIGKNVPIEIYLEKNDRWHL